MHARGMMFGGLSTRLRSTLLIVAATAALACLTLLAMAIRPVLESDADNAAPKGSADASHHQGDDWSQFLGPHGTGVSDETGLLETWPADGPPQLWSKRIGTGYGAPSVRGNRLVVHHRLGDEEIVECLRADNGEPMWQHKYESHFSDPYGYNNGPRCTPLLTDERGYTFGAEGKLVCVDLASGAPLWSRDTQQDFKIPVWFFGVGCTPILEDTLLIALVGGQPNSGVVAFDATTGKTVWESCGKDTWDGAETDTGERHKWSDDEQIVSYSSPIVATIHGRRHLLCLLRHGLVSLDPRDGSLNFKYWFRAREHESVNAARPLVVDDKIFISAAYQTGSALLQVSPDGKGCTELWRDRRNMLNHWSTSFHVDGCIYGFSGRHENEGTLRCLDMATGRLLWQTSGYEGDLNQLRQDAATGAIVDTATKKTIPWPFFGRGSKIRVGDKFIVLGERGTLSLVKINSQKFEEISRASYPQIRYPAWAAPVLSRGRLYLRSEHALLCLDVAAP